MPRMRLQILIYHEYKHSTMCATTGIESALPLAYGLVAGMAGALLFYAFMDQKYKKEMLKDA